MIPPALPAHAGGTNEELWSWTPDPIALALWGVAVLAYARGWTRLRRRGRTDLAGTGRAALFGAGATIGLLAVVSPVHALAERALSGHMAQHVLLADVAPALIVMGVAGPLGLHVIPRQILRGVGRSPRVRTMARAVVAPLVVVALWTTTMALWHVPAVHEAALASDPLHAVQHGSMMAAGVLVWIAVLDPTRSGRLSPAARAGIATAVLVLGMVLADVLIGSGPLYPAYAERPLPFGLTAPQDQTRAGLIMMAEPFLTLAPAAAILMRRHVEAATA